MDVYAGSGVWICGFWRVGGGRWTDADAPGTAAEAEGVRRKPQQVLTAVQVVQDKSQQRLTKTPVVQDKSQQRLTKMPVVQDKSQQRLT